MNAKKSVYREKEFEMYVLWKSLPAYFRGMKKTELHSHGFTDPLVMEVASIQSQTAFAKKFRIKDLGTLTDWNAKIKKNKLNTNSSSISFKTQALAVDDVLSTLPDSLLKKELHEQRRLIAELKKENKILTEQLRASISKKLAGSLITPAQTTQTITTSSEPQIVRRISLFKKALSFLTKKK